MKALSGFGFVLAASLFGCGDEKGLDEFIYGSDQPGAALAEGGEIRHERVNLLGMPPQTWIHVYQYNGPAASVNAPFPGPIPGSEFGNCVDQRNPATATWPFKPIE